MLYVGARRTTKTPFRACSAWHVHVYNNKHLRWFDGQVHNISPVIAEWDFKRLFGDPRDEAKFKLTPKGGSLHKGQRVNVQVGVGGWVFSTKHDNAKKVKVMYYVLRSVW